MTRVDIVRRNLAHLGIIMCHLSTVGFVLMISGILSSLLFALVFLLGLMLIVITVGTIFAVVPDYWDKLISFTEGSSVFMEIFGKSLPTIMVLSVVFCAASIFLTALDLKWDKAKPRFILSSVILFLLIVLVLCFALGVIRGDYQ